MWIFLITGTLIWLMAWDHIRKRHRVTFLKRLNISGPPIIPILGNFFHGLIITPENFFQTVGDYFKRFGKSFVFWFVGECVVFTTDLKLFECILNSSTQLEKAQVYQILRHFLSDGILMSSGIKWSARRKLMAPAFHFKCLDHFVEIMDKNSGVMVEKLRKVADGKTCVDIFKYVCLESLDVITEAAMGVQVNAQNVPNFPYTKALRSVIYIESQRISNLRRYDWLFPLVAPLVYLRLKKDIRTMQEFSDKVIRERREILVREKANGSYRPINLGDAEIGQKSKLTLLDILLQASINNHPLSDEDIREEVDGFIFAGDDTTTSGVSHALYVLSRHPEVQERIYEEILGVLGEDPDSPVTQSQLLDLKYLDCVIKETVRLHPPVALIGRYIPKDWQIGEQTIPGNTNIMLVLYNVLRDPEYFPDPLTFKPERWMDGEKASLPKFAYIPFSAGPKTCMGQKFASLHMKTLIFKVIRHFELLPLGEELKTRYTIILSSSSGINIGLRLRTC